METKHMRDVYAYRLTPTEEEIEQVAPEDRDNVMVPVYAEFETLPECGIFETTLTGDALSRMVRTLEMRPLDHVLIKPADWLETGTPRELQEYYQRWQKPGPGPRVSHHNETSAVIHNFASAHDAAADALDWTVRECLLKVLNDLNETDFKKLVLVVATDKGRDSEHTVYSAGVTSLESLGLLALGMNTLTNKE